MGMEVGDDLDLVTKIIKTIKSKTKKPVIVKVGIGNTDVLKLASKIQESGADAITAINTIRAMAINVETGMPILSNKVGGLSGIPLKPIGVRCVFEITKKSQYSCNWMWWNIYMGRCSRIYFGRCYSDRIRFCHRI